MAEDTTHYFSLSYGVYKKPPPPNVKKSDYVLIKSPDDRAVIYADGTNIDGNLDKDAAKLFVNGKEVTVLPDTSFSFKTPLIYGLNEFASKPLIKTVKRSRKRNGG